MILPFSTQLNGKPTYFVEKILIGIDKHLGIYHTEPFLLEYKKKYDVKTPVNINSKIHTIREDRNDRWKVGKLIHFYINNRTKNAFQFAPVLPVISTQKILVTYTSENQPRIFIDDKIFYVSNFSLEHDYRMLHFANNDGFDTVEEFFAYFHTEFKGKIIHWTEKRY